MTVFRKLFLAAAAVAVSSCAAPPPVVLFAPHAFASTPQV
jgi:hypothetical protein